MNFLIPCHRICSYLILPNQLELLLTQRLPLIIFFPIISPNQLELLLTQRLPLIIFFPIVSGNLTTAISDHLPQFLIPPHIFSNVPNRKTNIFERDWSRFNHEKFILD